MKLYEVPRGSTLNVKTNRGWEKVIFHHIDGAYSLITTLDNDTLHLSANTPMKKVGDCYEIGETK